MEKVVEDRPNTIAIDGPAASGKSTVGQRVANRLGFLYFDTGAMYRALTLLALEHGLDLSDGRSLGELAEKTIIEIRPPSGEYKDGRQYTVYVEGRDITWKIRHHLVDINVSQVAAHPEVREALIKQQRRVGQRGNVVMVGRDIGTVVMYDAPLKIYLDASIEERARRRYDECRGREQDVDYDELLASMRERDRYDSNRAHAPLRPAADAYLISSNDMSIDEVVILVLKLAREVMGPESSEVVAR
ncbi:MAG: (d)CMP kinase [Chloroflexota bacterium]|nr:(d)CMP kinase [Chloroflexota bacterium]